MIIYCYIPNESQEKEEKNGKKYLNDLSHLHCFGILCTKKKYLSVYVLADIALYVGIFNK